MRAFLVFFSLALIIACQEKVDIPSINEEKWKKDKFGCNGYREKVINQLLKEKDLLRGLSQQEIVHVLGKPDANELYKRSQKFFNYYLRYNSCNSQDETIKEQYLSIRFTATGLAKEIVLYEE